MTPTEESILNVLDTFRLKTLEGEWAFESKMTELMEKSPAYKDYYGAALEAKKSAKQDELLPELNSRLEVEYTVRQGIRAACLAREDVETVARVQLSILERLDRIQLYQAHAMEKLDLKLERQRVASRFAWICTGLLIYIAWRLS